MTSSDAESRHAQPGASPGRVAAIDIGTNSVLLLIAERGPDGALRPVDERATITRLGEGVDRTRSLAPAAVDRTLACLAEYATAIREGRATKVAVVGTSAMRDAGGADDFRRRATELLGVEPKTIAGAEEARLTFKGGLSGITIAGDVVVFDIGGGSTEFIRGDASSRSQRDGISLDVGSVRLTERHVRSDPPSASELAAVSADIERILAGAPAMQGHRLVGVAGTVTTLAAIARSVDPYDASRIHGAELSREEIDDVVARLQRVPLSERQRLPGLSPKRADVIVAGAMLCSAIVRVAGADRVVVSDRGVRWGLAEEL